MVNNNSHTKHKGGWGDEEGEAGTHDAEDVGSGTNWPMHASHQQAPINKVMECHRQEGSKDMEAGGLATRKHTGNITIIGTCATRVVLMCRCGTQAGHARKNAADRDTKKIVTGEITGATYKQDTMSASRRKTRTSCPPTRGHTKLDN